MLVGRRAGLGVLGCALLVALPLAAAFACGARATLTVSPSQAEPGAQVAGSGANFSNSHGGAPSAEPVVVRFGSAGPVLWSGRPAADGTISFSFTVPGVPPGEHLVVATQTNADGEPAPGTPAKALLTVTAPPTTTTTTPPPPTTTATSASSAPAVGVEQAAEPAAPNRAPAAGAAVMAPTTTAPAVSSRPTTSTAPAGTTSVPPASTAPEPTGTTVAGAPRSSEPSVASADEPVVLAATERLASSGRGRDSSEGSWAPLLVAAALASGIVGVLWLRRTRPR